jgi:hypothetical protein
MSWDTLQQLIRILLQFGGGFLVNSGFITDDMLTTGIGAVLSLGGILWWAFWEKTTRPATTAEKIAGQA